MLKFFVKGSAIDRLKAKKEDALYEIYDRYIPLVKGIVKNVLQLFKDEGLVDECVNDVFLAVWNNSHKFNGEDTEFKKWIATIAKYKAIDYYRKKVKESEIIVVSIDVYNEDVIDKDIVDDKISELMELINNLDEIDRKIIIMKFFLGEKAEDIARKVNLSKSSVDSRIYRAKKKIRCEVRKNNLEVI